MLRILGAGALLGIGGCDKDAVDDTGAGGADDTGGDDTADPIAPSEGSAVACVGSAVLEKQGYEFHTWDFSGTVVEDAAATGDLDTSLFCGAGVRRVLTVEEASGETWRVGYAILDDAGADDTPAMDLAPGDPVSVRFRATLSFGEAYGLVVRDGDGALVAAVEVGTWGGSLEAEDYPEVAISSGEVIATAEDSCGTVEHRALRFTVGDDGGEVAPYGTGSLGVAGQTLTTYAISNWDYLQPVSCTDVAGQQLWALFR